MDLNQLIEDIKTYTLLIICLPLILIFLVPFAFLADYIMQEEEKMYWGHSYD